uniref:Red-type RuBisCO activase n=1 Tax=Karenia brevis TaxID=156230 RepID=A0A0S2QDC2_KARBR|nr:red-type RuBisCO activase [Karenia brevis]
MSLRRIAGTVDKFMYKEGVAEVLDKLDREMIGLREVKDRVRAVASMLVIDKMRMKLGLETSMPSLHMSFTGAPGTGKTTIALRMGQILQKMGYCRTGHVVMATRDDLVGQYVGHTAPKTKEMVKKAMGGILFVDEAYYLYDEENERDYGAESCEILSSVMETMQDDLIVIFAGYKELMDHFYAGQPGIKSRVGNHIDFPNYSDDELIDIGKVMLNASSMTMTPDAIVALREYMVKRRQLPFFSNARTVRNAMDMARMKGSVRTYMEIVKPMMGEAVNLPMSAFTEVSAKDIPTIEEMQGGGDGQNKVMG